MHSKHAKFPRNIVKNVKFSRHDHKITLTKNMTCLKCNKKLTMKCECKIFHTQIVCCSCVSVCHIYSWWYRCYCRFVTAVIPLIAPTTFLRSISIIAFFVYAINTLLSCQIVKLMVESATILFVTHTHTHKLSYLSHSLIRSLGESHHITTAFVC